MKINVKLPKLHTIQKQIDDEAVRFNTVCFGRRAGKTTYILSRIVKALLAGKRIGLWLPNGKYTRTVWKQLEILIPEELITTSNKTERVIELCTGGHLRIHSAETESGRGEAYHEVYCDECTVYYDLETLWTQVIEPTLADYAGCAFFTTTPKGRDYFYQLSLKSMYDETWKHFTAPTISNPYLPESERIRIQNKPDTPYNQQEYWAKFLDSGGDLFGTLTYVQNPEQTRTYKIGIDIAQKRDFTVITCFNANNEMVDYDRYNQMSWENIEQRIMSFADKYPNTQLCMDSTGVGDRVCTTVENAGYNVKRYNFSERSRYNLLENLALMIDNNEISFMEIDELTKEFEAFGRYNGKGGKIKLLSAAAHDDICMSCGLAMMCDEVVEYQCFWDK